VKISRNNSGTKLFSGLPENNQKSQVIVSAQNVFVKKAAGLKQRKNRDSTGLFIIEGEKYVNEIPDDWDCEYVIANGFPGDISKYEERANVRFVSDAAFRAISDTVSPQGILALVRRKGYGFDILDGLALPFILLCEDMQDPGNLGALLRTSDAAGCDCVMLNKGSVDVFNPKVLRATAGSIFHIPVIVHIDISDAIYKLRKRCIRVLAAVPTGGAPVYDTNLAMPCAIMIGNESRGLSDKALSLADEAVSIPMPGRAESLNASAAAAMLIYEATRQRQFVNS